MRHFFLKQLDKLNQSVSDMGEKVDGVMSKTICALKNFDIFLSEEIVTGDKEINKLEHNIEQFCLNMIALQQPLASDLRVVTGCLKVITDIERIADSCSDICEIIKTADLSSKSQNLKSVISILEASQNMFKNVLKAFSNRSVNDSVIICKSDDAIDSLFSDIVLNICTAISLDPSHINSEIEFLMIAKYAERIADHCTNIAEWIIYIETGKHPELN